MTKEQALALFNQSLQNLARTGLLPPDLADFSASPDTLMTDLPIDSTGRMSLVHEIETRGGLDLPLDDIVDVETVDDFASVMLRSHRD